MVVGHLAVAQKIDYKSGVLRVDGSEVAKIVKIKDKENFGLTSTYEVFSPDGEKLIIATIATEFAERANDNSSYYYNFSFLTTNQTAIFTLNKLGTEKSLATLIGQGGIVVNNRLDHKMLNEFIAKKSKNPPVAIEYELVQRPNLGSVRMQGNQIIQGLTHIGFFKDVTGKTEYDTYEFSTAMGLVVARASFKGGYNAQSCLLTTLKDNQTRNVAIATAGTYRIPERDGVDRNEMALIRIANWLTQNGYL